MINKRIGVLSNLLVLEEEGRERGGGGGEGALVRQAKQDAYSQTFVASVHQQSKALVELAGIPMGGFHAPGCSLIRLLRRGRENTHGNPTNLLYDLRK